MTKARWVKKSPHQSTWTLNSWKPKPKLPVRPSKGLPQTQSSLSPAQENLWPPGTHLPARHLPKALASFILSWQRLKVSTVLLTLVANSAYVHNLAKSCCRKYMPDRQNYGPFKKMDKVSNSCLGTIRLRFSCYDNVVSSA